MILSREAGYLTVKGSGVSFAPKRIVLNDPDNNGISTDGIVTINIRNMNKDGYVDLTYRKMWALGRVLMGRLRRTLSPYR